MRRSRHSIRVKNMSSSTNTYKWKLVKINDPVEILSDTDDIFAVVEQAIGPGCIITENKGLAKIKTPAGESYVLIKLL